MDFKKLPQPTVQILRSSWRSVWTAAVARLSQSPFPAEKAHQRQSPKANDKNTYGPEEIRCEPRSGA
eukprot:11224214-Lingulodinium_polyedra.AAC.1